MTLLQTPIRVGILGFGLSGQVFHAPLITATDGMEVTMIGTSNRARSEAAKIACPRAEVVSSVDEMFMRADELDLLVVTTPNDSHVAYGRRAIESGLPVVIEKPLAVTAVEARDLVELAAQRHVSLVTFQNRRWDADFLTVQQAVASGELGYVFALDSRFVVFHPEVGSAWRESADRTLGGGVLFDLGAHQVDQALMLLGPVVTVYAELDARRPGANVPDVAFISLEHENGAKSHLTGSVVGSGPVPRFHVQGTLGSATVQDRDAQEQQLKSGLRPGDDGWGLLPNPEATITTMTGGRQVDAERGRQEEFYRILRDHLLGLCEAPVAASDPVYVVSILECAAQSVRERRPISLEPVIS